jgi:hypothetical protein
MTITSHDHGLCPAGRSGELGQDVGRDEGAKLRGDHAWPVVWVLGADSTGFLVCGIIGSRRCPLNRRKPAPAGKLAWPCFISEEGHPTRPAHPKTLLEGEREGVGRT